MRILLAFVLMIWPLAALAQQSDKDFLTTFLEENLSGAGRVVTITGFSGALSTRAGMAQMTIADDTGIWLTVKDVVLDWSRSSLLSGQVVIEEFSAGEIILDRIPSTGEGSKGFSVQARAFTLPDLPVSIDISNIAADRIVLGPAVLGQPVEGQLTATLSLAGGEGRAVFDLERTDNGPEGVFNLTALFNGTTRQLNLSLTAREGAEGVAVSLLGVPGRPSAEFTVQGSGPLEDFTADISLKTDGATRLAGAVTLFEDAGQQGFTADLAGDPTPVFLPKYAKFFGPDVSLRATGRRLADGRMELGEFAVKAQALTLDGTLSLDAAGAPEAFALKGQIGLPDGPVALPVNADTPISLGSGSIDLTFDRAVGPFWTGSAVLRDLSHPAFTAAETTLGGTGQIRQSPEGASFAGQLDFDLTGFHATDPALDQALGPQVAGDVAVTWRAGGDLTLTNLTLLGQGYRLGGTLSVGGLEGGFASTGRLTGTASDLSRFSRLTGMPLRGQADFATDFSNTFLTGALQASGTVTGRGLGLGIAALDNLLGGQSSVTFAARRDLTGTTVDRVQLTATGFSADISGRLTPEGADLTGKVAMSDLGVLGPRYGGGISGTARLTGPLSAAMLTVEAAGRNLSLGQTQADILLAGASQFTAAFDITPEGLGVRDVVLSTPQVSGTIRGEGGALRIVQRIADLGVLYPQFPGVLTVDGTARQDADGFQIDLAAKGPAQIDARVAGRLARDFSQVNLTVAGTASAGLANKLAAPRSLSGPVRFDLRMNGPISLRSLTGPVTIADGRLADPAQQFGITGIAGSAQLSNGAARVDLRAGVSTGGQLGITGNVAILEPYTADLAISVEAVRQRDPDLYTTIVDGNVTFMGPALGAATVAGALALGRTELRIPSTGFGIDGALPGLEHIHETQASLATRARAGLTATRAGGGSGGAGGYRLDLRIDAPNQIFIRGRGLDAELGGALILRGTTAAVEPSGSFNLIRGRLDILGRRLNLSEALLQMQGALVPFIRILASVESDGITASVRIEGPANDPAVTFTSNPDLPQEEVLARLLFDRGLETVTPFQAIQLAGAVATLAGRGGVGIIGNLRKQAGLDNLDITADGNGSAAVTLGKYLSEKVYTEVMVDQGGESSVSINLDLAPHITLKGELDSDGQTGIGIFLQRDY
jgi:translocation and assembly module TamB